MTAFLSLIFFLFTASVSMAVVAWSNHVEKKKKLTRDQLRVMKEHLEELEDILMALDGVCDNRAIPRLINDEVIDIYLRMLELEPDAAYLESGYAIAKSRSYDLSDEGSNRKISRVCRSDSQMARLKHFCEHVVGILQKQMTSGRISAAELASLVSELQWVSLQLEVVTFIAQGHKAYVKNDVLTANAFYKKAQTSLMRSAHPDERRHRMISQVADILFGRRRSLDEELMPETEFNPENIRMSQDKQEDLQKRMEELGNIAASANQVKTA